VTVGDLLATVAAIGAFFALLHRIRALVETDPGLAFPGFCLVLMLMITWTGICSFHQTTWAKALAILAATAALAAVLFIGLRRPSPWLAIWLVAANVVLTPLVLASCLPFGSPPAADSLPHEARSLTFLRSLRRNKRNWPPLPRAADDVRFDAPNSSDPTIGWPPLALSSIRIYRALQLTLSRLMAVVAMTGAIVALAQSAGGVRHPDLGLQIVGALFLLFQLILFIGKYLFRRMTWTRCLVAGAVAAGVVALALQAGLRAGLALAIVLCVVNGKTLLALVSGRLDLSGMSDAEAKRYEQRCLAKLQVLKQRKQDWLPHGVSESAVPPDSNIEIESDGQARSRKWPDLSRPSEAFLFVLILVGLALAIQSFMIWIVNTSHESSIASREPIPQGPKAFAPGAPMVVVMEQMQYEQHALLTSTRIDAPFERSDRKLLATHARNLARLGRSTRNDTACAEMMKAPQSRWTAASDALVRASEDLAKTALDPQSTRRQVRRTLRVVMETCSGCHKTFSPAP
jgi:hypothetical protein